MVEGAVQGAGAGGGVDVEEEEAFGKFHAFPQQKEVWTGDWAALEEYPAGVVDVLRFFLGRNEIIYT